jgi:hypothetical protein
MILMKLIRREVRNFFRRLASTQLALKKVQKQTGLFKNCSAATKAAQRSSGKSATSLTT